MAPLYVHEMVVPTLDINMVSVDQLQHMGWTLTIEPCEGDDGDDGRAPPAKGGVWVNDGVRCGADRGSTPRYCGDVATGSRRDGPDDEAGLWATDVTWTARDRETAEPAALPEDVRDWLYRYLR